MPRTQQYDARPPDAPPARDPAPGAGGTDRCPGSLRWAAAVANADWHVTAPLLVSLAAALGTGVHTVTAALGAYALGHGLALPLWGRAADRHGPGRVLRAGLALAALGSAACALCASGSGWLALRAATGAAFAAVTPAVALYCHETGGTAPARQRRFADVLAVSAAAAVAAPLCAALLAHAASWRLVFLTLALLTAAAAARTTTLPPTPHPPERPSPSAAPRPSLPARPLLVLLLLGAAEGAALLALPALLVPALAAHGGGEGAGGTAVAMAYGAAVLGGGTLLRRGVFRWSPARLVTVGGLLGVTAALTGAAWVTPAALTGVAVLLGLSWTLLHTTLQTWLPRLLPAHRRATAASLPATSGVLAGGLAVELAAPQLRAGRTAGVFLVAAALCALLTAAGAALARGWATRHVTGRVAVVPSATSLCAPSAGEVSGTGQTRKTRHGFVSSRVRIDRRTRGTPMSRRILVVLSEYGYWGEELIGPLETFDKAGYHVTFATPTGKRPVALPPSMDPDYIDPPLGRSVTTPEMAAKVKAVEASDRLDHPLDLSSWLPDRPYRSKPYFLRDWEAYNTRLEKVQEQIADRYDALLIVGGSGPIVDLANNWRVHDLILAFYALDRPIAAECYGVTCLAFARDQEDRQSIIRGKHVTGHCIEYDYLDGTGFVGTDFNMGPPPYPLEYILRDATAPGGAYHGNFGKTTSVIVDYPFITGRSTPDSYLTGQKTVEVLENGLRQWGFKAQPKD